MEQNNKVINSDFGVVKDLDTGGCPVCKGTIIYNSSTGEYVCSNCGLVVGHEYVPAKTYSDVYTRANSYRPSRQYNSHGFLGSIIPQSKNQRYKQLARIQRTMLVRDGFMRVLHYIYSISTSIMITKNIAQRAEWIAKKAYKTINYRNRIVLAYASLYIAARERDPIQIYKIIKHLRERQYIRRPYIMLQIAYRIYKKCNIPKPDYQQVLQKIVNTILYKLNIQQYEIKKAAEQYLTMLKSGSQIARAAAAVYVACKLNNIAISQHSISELLDVPEYTIRVHVAAIRKKLRLSKYHFRRGKHNEA